MDILKNYLDKYGSASVPLCHGTARHLELLLIPVSLRKIKGFYKKNEKKKKTIALRGMTFEQPQRGRERKQNIISQKQIKVG